LSQAVRGGKKPLQSVKESGKENNRSNAGEGGKVGGKEGHHDTKGKEITLKKGKILTPKGKNTEKPRETKKSKGTGRRFNSWKAGQKTSSISL